MIRNITKMPEVVNLNNYVINCPCCNNKIKISVNDSSHATAFLLDKNNISQDELFQKMGIELGIVESEVNK